MYDILKHIHIRFIPNRVCNARFSWYKIWYYSVVSLILAFGLSHSDAYCSTYGCDCASMMADAEAALASCKGQGYHLTCVIKSGEDDCGSWAKVQYGSSVYWSTKTCDKFGEGCENECEEQACYSPIQISKTGKGRIEGFSGGTVECGECKEFQVVPELGECVPTVKSVGDDGTHENIHSLEGSYTVCGDADGLEVSIKVDFCTGFTDPSDKLNDYCEQLIQPLGEPLQFNQQLEMYDLPGMKSLNEIYNSSGVLSAYGQYDNGECFSMGAPLDIAKADFDAGNATHQSYGDSPNPETICYMLRDAGEGSTIETIDCSTVPDFPGWNPDAPSSEEQAFMDAERNKTLANILGELRNQSLSDGELKKYLMESQVPEFGTPEQALIDNGFDVPAAETAKGNFENLEEGHLEEGNKLKTFLKTMYDGVKDRVSGLIDIPSNPLQASGTCHMTVNTRYFVWEIDFCQYDDIFNHIGDILFWAVGVMCMITLVKGV